MKYEIKVYFMSYKTLHLFLNIVTIYSYILFPMFNQLSHHINDEFQQSFLDPQSQCVFQFIIHNETKVLAQPKCLSLGVKKELKIAGVKSVDYRGCGMGQNFTFRRTSVVVHDACGQALLCCRIKLSEF